MILIKSELKLVTLTRNRCFKQALKGMPHQPSKLKLVR